MGENIPDFATNLTLWKGTKFFYIRYLDGGWGVRIRTWSHNAGWGYGVLGDSLIPSPLMSTYSRADFERISAAIEMDCAEVLKYAARFDSAADWYRSFRRAPERLRFSVTRKRLTQIANSARKLRRNLEVYDYRKGPTDPVDTTLLELLSGENASEDDVIRSASVIQGLIEIFDAIDAGQVLERAARQAADDAECLSRLTGVKGRRGDHALNVWIADMMSLYKAITGKDPRMSVVSSGPDQGKASGPFLRFLEAASGPVECDGDPLCLKAVRERVRAILESSPGRK
jgi:hypothetical protein